MALDTESFDILLPTLQRFIQERLVPAENYLEEHDEVPADIVEDMKEMGLFGLSSVTTSRWLIRPLTQIKPTALVTSAMITKILKTNMR